MELFPERLLQQILAMPGAGHSYFKQLCGPEASHLRQGLQSWVLRQPEALQNRALQNLTSLDNRRFFQAFAEVSALAALEKAGWKSKGYTAPYHEIHHPDAGHFRLSVLALLQQRRPGGEEGLHSRLVAALGRVSARHRFAVLVRRWLPPELDPEPVRRALELWMAQVAHGQWEGRYATYEDERLSLEFCLTGEMVQPGQSALAFCMGPYYAHRTMEALEPRAVGELDRYNASPYRRTPLLLACVTDQSWLLNDGYLFDFLYGRPDAIVSGETGMERHYAGSPDVCVFRDPLYPFVSGVMMVDRDPLKALEPRMRVCLNPWASQPLRPEQVAFRSFAEDPQPRQGRQRVLRWHPGEGTKVEIV